MISLNEKSLKSIAYAIAQSSNISQSKVLEIFSKKIGYTNYQALRNDFSKGAEKIEHSVKTAGSWQDRMITNNKLNDHEQLAKDYILPESVMLEVSNTYVGIASKIVGRDIVIPEDPRQEVITILDNDYGLIVK